MKLNNSTCQGPYEQFCEEKLSISSFKTIRDLKAKIRGKMADYETRGWNLINITSCGPFLLLRFKHILPETRKAGTNNNNWEMTL